MLPVRFFYHFEVMAHVPFCRNLYSYKAVITVMSIILPFHRVKRVPRGSVLRCRNPGVLGSSRTRSSGFFRGSVLGQDTSELSLVLVKPRKA